MTKILLVEDDKSLREIYGVRLLAEGYDIISAGDGEAALAMAIKDRPQLILSDVMMPKISGFDMLDILRSTTETKDIKVIMMTALSSEDQRQRGESLGADRYLVKSQVGIEDVVRTVHEVLGDAPGVAGAQAPTQATPTPDTVVRPSAPVQPTAPSQPQTPSPSINVPSRTAPQEQQSAPQPTPMTAPMPQPQQQNEPDMPQPTAPFSTPRPAGLGDRVIQPISNPAEQETDALAQRMQDELTDTPPTPGVVEPSEPTPDAPSNEPVEEAPQTPPMQPIAANMTQDQPAAPNPHSQPTDSQNIPPAQPTPPATDVEFEETPRPDTPPQPQQS